MESKLEVRKDGSIAIVDIDGPIGWDFMRYLDGETQNTKETMKRQLAAIEALKTDKKIKSVEVNINSYGGETNHGFSIHDLLAELSVPVVTSTYGYTASAATIIAQAGKKRRMSANGLYLIHHSGYSYLSGNAKEIKQWLDELEKTDRVMLELYVRRSGKSEKEIMELMDVHNGNGRWLTASEALDFGLIDEIIVPSQSKVAAAFDLAHPDLLFTPQMMSAYRLPPLPNAKSTAATTSKPDPITVTEPLTINNNSGNEPLDNVEQENTMDPKVIAEVEKVCGAPLALRVSCGEFTAEAAYREHAAAQAAALVETQGKLSAAEASLNETKTKLTAIETELNQLKAGAPPVPAGIEGKGDGEGKDKDDEARQSAYAKAQQSGDITGMLKNNPAKVTKK